MFRRRTRRRSLGYRGETLENRAMLAGSVLVSLSGSTVIVTGDNADNDISITEEAGIVTVAGNNDTTINGSEEAFVLDLSDANVRNIKAKLNGGDDVVDIVVSDTFSVGRDVSIDLGSGNDTLNIAGPDDAANLIGDDLIIRGRSGNDSVNVEGFGIRDDLSFSGGSGNDRFSMSAMSVGDDVRISTSGGNDTVFVDDVPELDGISEEGNTIGDDLSIRTGGGNDFIDVAANSIGDDVRINSGSRNDDVLLDDNEIGDDASILTGAGNDVLAAEDNAITDNVRILTGSGADGVLLFNNDVGGNVTGSLGSGNDGLASGDNTVGGRLSITGSSGTDSLVTSGDDAVDGRVRVRSFATVLAEGVSVDLTATTDDQTPITIPVPSELAGTVPFGEASVADPGSLGATVDVNEDGSITYTPAADGEDAIIVEYSFNGVVILTVNVAVTVTVAA